MGNDQIEKLVEQAHGLFDKTSIFEVFDLPCLQEVFKTLSEFYGPVDIRKVDQYLTILDRLRLEIGECESEAPTEQQCEAMHHCRINY